MDMHKTQFSTPEFLAAALCLLCLLVFAAHAQDVTNGRNVGFPPNGVFDGSDFDNVQLNNGNLHIEIPLWSTKGRGLPVSYKYVYDSKGWSFRSTCDKQGICTDTVTPESGNNLVLKLAGSFNYTAGFKTVVQACSLATYSTFTNYVLRDRSGTKHHFMPDPISPSGQTCWPSGVSTLYADDGSGWILRINSSTGVVNSAVRKDGTVVYPGSKVEDSNGNELIVGAPTGTDTLGRTVQTDGSYYDSSGTLRSTSVTPQNVPIYTNQCPLSGADFCHEYANTLSLPQVLTLPNGMKYTFTYDLQGAATHPYDGEPLSVALPTGGQISWTWSGAADGGPNVVSRTVSGDPAPWQYSGFGGSLPPGFTSTGTVTDPAGNDKQFTCTYYAQGKVDANGGGICFLTKLQYFKGSHTTGTLVKTVVTDFSNTTSPRNTVLPIRETTTWNDTNQVSKIETDWDS